MRVQLSPDNKAVVVTLDNGTRIGAFGVMQSPYEELQLIESMLKRVTNEALLKERIAVKKRRRK